MQWGGELLFAGFTTLCNGGVCGFIFHASSWNLSPMETWDTCVGPSVFMHVHFYSFSWCKILLLIGNHRAIPVSVITSILTYAISFALKDMNPKHLPLCLSLHTSKATQSTPLTMEPAHQTSIFEICRSVFACLFFLGGGEESLQSEHLFIWAGRFKGSI